MNFTEYQELAKSTAVYPSRYFKVYPALGLCGEAGEVAALASDLDISLDDVAKKNVQKLASRKKRNKIGGSGDNR